MTLKIGDTILIRKPMRVGAFDPMLSDEMEPRTIQNQEQLEAVRADDIKRFLQLQTLDYERPGPTAIMSLPVHLL